MSPQSTLCVVTNPTSSMNEGANFFPQVLSKSKIVQHTALAYSNNKRLDTDLTFQSDALVNPLDVQCQSPKKRKIEGYTANTYQSFPDCSVNFLSAIFNDIAEAQGRTSCDNTPLQRPPSDCDCPEKFIDQSSMKKQRLSLSRSLSRCAKSYKNLQSCRTSDSAATVSTQATFISHGSCISMNQNQDGVSEQPSPIPTDDNGMSPNHYEDVANIIDNVLDVDLFLPNLPATVSEQTCTTPIIRKLTPAPVKISDTLVKKTTAAPKIEQAPSEIIKDSYGWFVETDKDGQLRKRAEAISHAVNKARHFPEVLSLTIGKPPDSVVEDDHELEWAKAADTVDDVLGDFF